MTVHVKIDHALLSIGGDLNFDSISEVWAHSLPWFSIDVSHLQLDLKEVTSANSAVLTLLIEWLKYGKSLNKTIHFKNIPQQILAMAKIAGLEEILSFVHA